MKGISGNSRRPRRWPQYVFFYKRFRSICKENPFKRRVSLGFHLLFLGHYRFSVVFFSQFHLNEVHRQFSHSSDIRIQNENRLNINFGNMFPADRGWVFGDFSKQAIYLKSNKCNFVVPWKRTINKKLRSDTQKYAMSRVNDSNANRSLSSQCKKQNNSKYKITWQKIKHTNNITNHHAMRNQIDWNKLKVYKYF